MDWKKVTGDDTLRGSVREERERRRVRSDLKSESETMEDKGIDVLNQESVCVHRPYSTGNPVDVDFAEGVEHSLGEFRCFIGSPLTAVE